MDNKLTIYMPSFIDEMEKIGAAHLSYEEISAILKEAGLLANAGKWMQQNAKPMAQRAGNFIRNESATLQGHVADAFAKNPGGVLNPMMPVHGVSQFAEGAGHYLAQKLPHGPKGLLRKGVAAGVGNGLEALVNPARVATMFG